MIKTAIAVSLLGMAHAHYLSGCHAATGNFDLCACNVDAVGGWCWIVSDGYNGFVKEGDGGWPCSSYDWYDSGSYCQNTYTGHPSYVIAGTAAPAAPVPAPTPAPGAAPGGVAPSGDYSQTIQLTGYTDMNTADAQKILDLMNKMRCAVGSPPMVWNADLASQAQAEQNRYGGMTHSDCYHLNIPSGENLASGNDVEMAAYMWFSEFTQLPTQPRTGTGHYDAMVWRGVTEVGCGKDALGGYGGTIRCQFVGNPLPNMAGSFAANVPSFDVHSNANELAQCGLSASTISSYVTKFQGWGILQPAYGTYYEQGWTIKSVQQMFSPTVIGMMAASTLVIGLGIARAVRNRASSRSATVLSTEEDTEMLMGEE